MAKRRKQIAALPMRRADGGKLEILLVTSRGSGKWLIPKGRLSRGSSEHTAAHLEAKEEAGVSGDIERKPLGRYKARKAKRSIQVKVFALKVRKQRSQWKEQNERRRKWAKPHKAAAFVRDRGLKKLILQVAGKI